jgi:hypothetical protein
MSFLTERDREYLVNRDLTYKEVTDSNHKGVVLIDSPLPIGLYNQPQADILILLPLGYPDVPTDMFYLFPWVTLVSSGKYPTTADQIFQFEGKSWQRWSRHNNEWRIGIDGIHTSIVRMENALKEAK